MINKGNSYGVNGSRSYKLCVLVVEDDRTHRSLMEKILKSCGIRTQSAENGAVALSKLRDGEHVDLVLMDWDMPEMDGIETVRIIRQREIDNDLPHVPIIAFTAHRDPGDCERCIAAGMDGYLPKSAWLPKWRETLIDNLQGLVAGNFSLQDFSNLYADERESRLSYAQEGNAMNDAEHYIALDEFDTQIFDHAAHLLKDELGIAIEEFFEDAEMYMQGIAHGINHNNAEEISKSSHPLKSNTRSFGLISMSDIAQKINEATREPQNPDQAVRLAARLYAKLEQSFGIAKQNIESQLPRYVA